MVLLMTYELFYCTKIDNGSLLIKNISGIEDIRGINNAIINIEEPNIHSINLYKHITDDVSYYDSELIIYHLDRNTGVFHNDSEDITLDENSIKFVKNKLK